MVSFLFSFAISHSIIYMGKILGSNFFACKSFETLPNATFSRIALHTFGRAKPVKGVKAILCNYSFLCCNRFITVLAAG